MNPVIKTIAMAAILAILPACSQSDAQARQVSADSDIATVTSNWTVDKSVSSIAFTGSMGGDEFTGAFSEFDAQIKFDIDNPGESDIRVSIDMASADAQDSERNDALPGKEWFFVKSFPKAQFASDNVVKKQDGTYEAAGQLTIRDVTQPVTLPFSLKIEDGVAQANGQLSINRSDFGVGTGMWKNEEWVAHKVDINISVAAISK